VGDREATFTGGPTARIHSPILQPGCGLVKRLPIWVLSFWDRLSEAYDTCLSWRRCLDWVNALCTRRPANQRLASELYSLFQRVCWYGYLGGKRRDRHVNDIFDLLSNNELDSGQIGDLLELIEWRLEDASDSHYLIAPPDLSTLILYSHRDHTKHTYRKQPCQQLVEEELVQRRRFAVASIAWISVGGHGHWISYIADPITLTIFGTILLAKTVGVLRNRSVEWLVNGYNAVNKPEVVKKVCTPSFHPQCTRTYESSDIQLGLGVVQSWRDQSLVRMFDVSRSSSGPGRSSQCGPKTS